MTENKFDSSKRIVRSVMCGLLCSVALGCSAGTQTADTGGMSGTGVSQGSIVSFGSIFVNGVEWQIGNAQIEVDDVVGVETDLRGGMPFLGTPQYIGVVELLVDNLTCWSSV